jgi:hypothetical protein
MKLIDTSQSQKINTLQGNAYFTELPESLLKEIAEQMQLREYQHGDVLFWEADPSRSRPGIGRRSSSRRSWELCAKSSPDRPRNWSVAAPSA